MLALEGGQWIPAFERTDKQTPQDTQVVVCLRIWRDLSIGGGAAIVFRAAEPQDVGKQHKLKFSSLLLANFPQKECPAHKENDNPANLFWLVTQSSRTNVEQERVTNPY